MSRRVVVVGAGIFGVTAALELRRRGDDVTLVDRGPVPHPLAESTDISKAVRMEYGSDVLYAKAMAEALDGWRAWNADGETPLFHAHGMLFLASSALAPGGFEEDSAATCEGIGAPIERLDRAAIARRFPAWARAGFEAAVFGPNDGFAESGAVVAALVAKAVADGVAIVTSGAAAVESAGSRASGVRLRDGSFVPADVVVVAAGGWSADLVPELAPVTRTVAQSVFHLVPDDPSPFVPARFPPFGADIAKTGFYGFPLHAGVVKIANHGPGRAMHPSFADRVVTGTDRAALREFLRLRLPELEHAPIALERVCVYSDSLDEHFVIDRVPGREGLVVATGGSGHGFKFAPLLGRWIADVVDDAGHALDGRFRFRAAGAGREEARARR